MQFTLPCPQLISVEPNTIWQWWEEKLWASFWYPISEMGESEHIPLNLPKWRWHLLTSIDQGLYLIMTLVCFMGQRGYLDQQVIFFIMFYFRALKDANKAISLAKTWPKGYFRKGRALSGLRVSIHTFRSSSPNMFYVFSHLPNEYTKRLWKWVPLFAKGW